MTSESRATWVPGVGSVLTTVPFGWSESTFLNTPWRWAAVRADCAALRVCPTMLGTFVGWVPSERVKVTVVPLSTKSSAGGSWLITRLAATLAL